MLSRLRSAIRTRLLAVLLILHAGTLVQVAALLGWVSEASTGRWLWIGFAGMYGSFVLGTWFVLVPALPWVRRARRISAWRTWLVEELPEILAMIPVIVQALRTIRDALQGLEPEPQAAPASSARRPRSRAGIKKRQSRT